MTPLAVTFLLATQTFDLPPGLLSAICFVESGHNPDAFNKHDGHSPSVGICQIKLSTARLIGFEGTAAELQGPDINIHFAGKYLRQQLNRYDNDVRKGIAAYNAGSHRVNDRGLIKNRKYVNKVVDAWIERR